MQLATVALGASHSGTRPTMDGPTLIRVWLRRLPLILVLGVLCALAAWWVGRDQPSRYRTQLSYVLRPDHRLSLDEANHAAATLENRDSAITQTVVGLLGAAPSGGGAQVQRTTSLRPGTNIIDVDLEGDRAPVVAAAARRYAAAAPTLVSSSYRIYALQPISVPGAPAEVASSLLRTVVLALLLGCALGVGVATVEHAAGGTARLRRPLGRRAGDAPRTDEEEAAIPETGSRWRRRKSAGGARARA